MRNKSIMSNVRQEVHELWEKLSGFGKKLDEKLNGVRISRNLADFPFSCQACENQKIQISQAVIKACQVLPNFDNDGLILNWKSCNAEERKLLLHVCFLENPTDETVLVYLKAQNLFIIINDCDHIRLQGIALNLHLRSLWRKLDILDSQLEENLVYSFDPERGYSTCSTDTLGTGIKGFSLIHIPAICYKQQLGQIVAGLEAMSLKLEPYAKIEDRILGHLFFVTNVTSIGCNEELLLNHIEEATQAIITREKLIRKQLISDNRNFIKDSVGRSLGVLRNCYELSFEEGMNLISIIIMAMDLGALSNKKCSALMKLWACMPTENLQQFLNKELKIEEEKQVRADVVRKFFIRNEDFCSIETKGGAYVS